MYVAVTFLSQVIEPVFQIKDTPGTVIIFRNTEIVSTLNTVPVYVFNRFGLYKFIETHFDCTIIMSDACVVEHVRTLTSAYHQSSVCVFAIQLRLH